MDAKGLEEVPPNGFTEYVATVCVLQPSDFMARNTRGVGVDQ